MKVLVVYESMFGNTRDVAAAIADGLKAQSRVDDVTLVEVSDAPASSEGFDLVVVGGPVHAWSMTRGVTRDGARDEARLQHPDVVSKGEGIRDWLDKLPPTDEPVDAAAFDTAAKTVWFPVGSAAKPAARRLGKRGFHLLANPEHFYVGGKYGPLLEGELERAQGWAEALVDAHLTAVSAAPDEAEPSPA